MPKPTVLIDTREQKPWKFSNSFKSKKATLKVGDYTLAGWQKRLVIERKSFDDFFYSFTKTRDRMMFRLEEMADFEMALLIVDATPFQISQDHPRTRVSGDRLTGTVAYLCARLGISLMMGSRAQNQHYVERLLLSIHEGAAKIKAIDDIEKRRSAVYEGKT